MAEKEQRIWLEFDIPKPKGSVEATRCTTMTRTEAIEKMAKVIWKYDQQNEFHEWHEIAEVALNALLGEK